MRTLGVSGRWDFWCRLVKSLESLEALSNLQKKYSFIQNGFRKIKARIRMSGLSGFKEKSVKLWDNNRRHYNIQTAVVSINTLRKIFHKNGKKR